MRIRQALASDAAAMHTVRMSVQENVLSRPDAIALTDYVWLTTERCTRAEMFYRARGWNEADDAPHGEVRFGRRHETLPSGLTG